MTLILAEVTDSETRDALESRGFEDYVGSVC